MATENQRKNKNIFPLMLIVVGGVFFTLGFHMVDTSYNMKYFECYTNDTVIETNLFFKDVPINQNYQIGWIFIFGGMFVILLGYELADSSSS